VDEALVSPGRSCGALAVTIGYDVQQRISYVGNVSPLKALDPSAELTIGKDFLDPAKVASREMTLHDVVTGSPVLRERVRHHVLLALFVPAVEVPDD
jgi:hypothetical protein